MFLLEEKESACRVRFKQIKSLLFNWSEKGKFSFSTKPSDWEKQGEKLLDTDEGYKLVPYYYAYAISYIVEKKVALSCLTVSTSGIGHKAWLR